MRSLLHSLLFGPRAAARWRLLFAAMVVGVAWLALTPSPPPSIDLGWDKLNHLVAFAALAFSGWLGLRARARRRWMLAIALLAFGGGIEIVQAYVPGRDAEWADLGADALGIVAGLGLSALAVAMAASARLRGPR